MVVYKLPSGKRMTRFDDYGMVGEQKVSYGTLGSESFRTEYGVEVVPPNHDEVDRERHELYKDANLLYLAWQTSLSMRDPAEKILAREQAWKARIEEIRNGNPYPEEVA